MTTIARVLRDLCLLLVGVLAFVATPPSLQDIGVQGALSQTWALMMLGGAAASLWGVLAKNEAAEIMGCAFVGGAFVVWAVAAITQPDPTISSLMVAFVFLSGTAGQIYRVGMIAAGRVIR